jgi:Uma2 family endonuclease
MGLKLVRHGMDLDDLLKKRWTAAEYDAAVARGDIAEDLRVELLDGVIVEMTPQGPMRVGAVAELQDGLVLLSRGKPWRVIVQSTLQCGENRPEPDLALVPRDGLHERLPGPALLVIEVADSTVAEDRKKTAHYAKAGVPEHWLVDVQARVIEIRTDPVVGEATYLGLRKLELGDVLTSATIPELKMPVGRVFGVEH